MAETVSNFSQTCARRAAIAYLEKGFVVVMYINCGGAHGQGDIAGALCVDGEGKVAAVGDGGAHGVQGYGARGVVQQGDGTGLEGGEARVARDEDVALAGGLPHGQALAKAVCAGGEARGRKTVSRAAERSCGRKVRRAGAVRTNEGVVYRVGVSRGVSMVALASGRGGYWGLLDGLLRWRRLVGLAASLLHHGAGRARHCGGWVV